MVMAERRMLLNSAETFIGTMDIMYIAYNKDENTGNLIPIDFNCGNNIKIINHDFSGDEGYVTIGFKNELLIPSHFIINDYIFQLYFSGLQTYIPNPIVKFDNESLILNYYNSEYIDEIDFQIPCEFIGDCIYADSNLREIKIYNKTIYSNEWINLYLPNYTIIYIYDNYNVHYVRFPYGIKEICANAHILYDIMRYNNVEEGDEEAQNYKILNNRTLIISSPTEYITTIPNVDLGDNNYIKSVNNYMYDENYITEYVCSSNITYLRKGITLPQNATVYFPDTVTDIDSNTFENESNLKKVIIFGNCKLTYLDGFNNSGLENIEIYSDKITDIKIDCFNSCFNLIKCIIPKSVLAIKNRAFKLCTSLQSINYKGTIEEWNNIDIADDWRDGSVITTIHCSNGDIDLNATYSVYYVSYNNDNKMDMLDLFRTLFGYGLLDAKNNIENVGRMLKNVDTSYEEALNISRQINQYGESYIVKL